ncbi:MAG: group 1 glycosyl transferase [uncultured bacterium (gcode 4)]|uniref:Group 1 glycosyl transferase n=1 Tax=uncultured bacterium (gcode 4) TaxID=1234023 RepID=K2GG27_9BACT|nr:MAG: group 1 glycosyl transferase [uncultured bacterium (gcode 4)]
MKKILVIYHPLFVDPLFAKEYIDLNDEFEIKVICANKLDMWKWFNFNEIKVPKEILNKLDFEGFNMLNSFLPFFRNLFSGDAVKKIIEYKPDIIHIYSEIFSPSLTQAIYIRNKHLPQTKLINYSWENLDFNKFPYSIFWKYNAKHINKVLCANDEAIWQVERFWVPNIKTRKMYWWTDLTDFPYFEHSIEWKKHFKLLFIWRLLKDKWLQDIIEALKILWDWFSLYVIWDWIDKEFFMQLAEELWVQDRVEFIWKVSHENIKNYFNLSDLFILPSRTKKDWKEQFWRVIPESMACWVPVIGSSSWAIPEVIWDAGLVFEEGNVTDLVKKIGIVVSDSDKYKEYSLKWLDRVKNNFSSDAFEKNLIDIYKEI